MKKPILDRPVNRFGPYYDPDEGVAIMSVAADGSWVHISYVQELLAEAKALKALIDELEVTAVHSR